VTEKVNILLHRLFYDYCLQALEIIANTYGQIALIDHNVGRLLIALSLRAVRTRTHKFTGDLQSGGGELNDLENDPDEIRNLFGSD
jgi:hypothetical protein